MKQEFTAIEQHEIDLFPGSEHQRKVQTIFQRRFPSSKRMTFICDILRELKDLNFNDSKYIGCEGDQPAAHSDFFHPDSFFYEKTTD